MAAKRSLTGEQQPSVSAAQKKQNQQQQPVSTTGIFQDLDPSIRQDPCSQGSNKQAAVASGRRVHNSPPKHDYPQRQRQYEYDTSPYASPPSPTILKHTSNYDISNYAQGYRAPAGNHLAVPQLQGYPPPPPSPPLVLVPRPDPEPERRRNSSTCIIS
ncbi:hypothetical protein COLO4_02766 [Corchorus olitorius]|uniref:Uncharacterized protein n=1 Tax=Corchorus olitorius TaxID=93759 RepID=A0A1R3L0B0_9ROSI|nr:hypothetical protein COLO4_02766 [Corchorus olitorius]